MKYSKVSTASFRRFLSGSLTVLFGAYLAIWQAPAHAQFDRLLQQLQKIAPPQQGGPAPVAAPAGGQRPARNDAAGLNICKMQMVATTTRSAAEVERLVLSQFKAAGEQFFNEAYNALIGRPRTSAAIPNLQVFSGSFETERGNALFSTFLAWPEPELMAEIIAETQNRRDPQLADDARVILALAHWAMPGLSRQDGAWLQQAQQLRSAEHITASCLWARLHATGEAGAVSPGDALGQYRQCGALPEKYRESEGRKTLDPQNYFAVVLLPETLKIIATQNPRALSQMGPLARDMKASADAIEIEQENFRRQFIATAPGRTAAAATRLVARAEEVGAKAISSSQQLSRSYGDLQANVKQAESGQGNREGEFIPNAAIQQRLSIMAAAAKNAEGADVAALNEVRQLQGAAAVGLTQSRNIVAQEMFRSLFGGGGIMAAARYTKVFYDLDAASIRSCRAYNSFQQAARARNVNTAEDDKSSTAMLNDMIK